MGTNFDQSSIPKLITTSKIVSLTESKISVDTTNLQSYCATLNELFDKSVPVKIIGIGGPIDKGKHLALNLLIHCLSGTNNVELSPLTKQFLEQLPSNSVYFWPQPFLVIGNDAKTQVVLVAHFTLDDGEEECGELEEFLMTACARILELHWKNNKLQLKVLEPCAPAESSSDEDDTGGSLEEMCNTSLHVVRCSRSSVGTSSEESLQEPSSALPESATKSVMKLITNVIEAVTDSNRNDITIGGISDFLQAAANSPQELRQARIQMQEYLVLAVAQVNKEFPDKLKSWIEETLSLDNIHKLELVWDQFMEAILGEYEPVVDSSVWDDFKEKLEFHGNDYKTSLLIISSGSKQVHELATQELQSTGYVSDKTLEQIGNNQLEALDVGDTSLGEFTWEMTKVSCTKLLNLHKDLNYKIVLKEKEKFTESLAKVGTDFEVEFVRHLNGSGYDPKLVKSIRGKLIKSFRKNIKETFRSVDTTSSCSEENTSSLQGMLVDDKTLAEIQDLIYHSLEGQSPESVGSERMQEAVSKLMQVYQEEVEGCLENAQDLEQVHEQMISQLANTFCKVLKSLK